MKAWFKLGDLRQKVGVTLIKEQQKAELLIIIGGSFKNDPIEGITKGKQYTVTYEGKDEIEVINDFGKKECYSKNCFIYKG